MWRTRPASQRGHFDHGWLDTSHTFSFAGYRDREWMGFHKLRVINEDRVAAGHGFGEHGHNDMEIFSLVLAGELEHRDSMGNGAVLRPGELQYMSAGRGIQHAERNPSATEPNHFYQIWLEPAERGLPPVYGQLSLSTEEGWQTVATPQGSNGSLAIRQDAVIRHGRVNRALKLTAQEGRGTWVQIVSGSGTIDERPFSCGDGFFAEEAGESTRRANGPAEVLWFDLP